MCNWRSRPMISRALYKERSIITAYLSSYRLESSQSWILETYRSYSGRRWLVPTSNIEAGWNGKLCRWRSYTTLHYGGNYHTSSTNRWGSSLTYLGWTTDKKIPSGIHINSRDKANTRVHKESVTSILTDHRVITIAMSNGRNRCLILIIGCDGAHGWSRKPSTRSRIRSGHTPSCDRYRNTYAITYYRQNTPTRCQMTSGNKVMTTTPMSQLNINSSWWMSSRHTTVHGGGWVDGIGCGYRRGYRYDGVTRYGARWASATRIPMTAVSTTSIRRRLRFSFVSSKNIYFF